MADHDASVPAPQPLPESPNLDWLRKQAKRRLAEMRASDSAAQLADAQLDIARRHGFPSWRALKAHIDGLSVEGRLFAAAKAGDVSTLTELLDQHPDKLRIGEPPYGHTLLHIAAANGHVAAVDLLLRRGLDVNARERGDRTYAMHWAAAAGHLDVVRRLIEAAGDVVGRGDDHLLEVIGWATCWEGCDDAPHRAIVDELLRHGARHHIFSAIAMDLDDELRRIVAADPSALHRRMSRNENHQLPLHFAARMDRARMVALLIDLGADPLAVDGSGQLAAAYAMTPGVDRAVMEKLRAMTATEMDSAERGRRRPNGGPADLIAALALHDWDMASRLSSDNPSLVQTSGALPLMAKRNDVEAARWLLDRGADPSARWTHWDAEVTPLHLAALAGHPDIARLLLERGADPSIKDSKHDGDAMDWARFFHRQEIMAMLEAHAGKG